jgi:hypothetical protein
VKHKKAKHRAAETNSKTKQQSSSQFSGAHYIRRFEAHERICEFVFVVCALLLSGMSAFGAHKIPIIWTTGIGLCAAIIAICFWLTDRELGRRHSEQLKEPKPMSDERPNINITSHNQKSGSTSINTGTVNLGPRPRVITPESRRRFIAKAQAAPKEGAVVVGFVADNDESHNLASQVRDLLSEAGYSVNPNLMPVTRFGTPLKGVVLEIRDKDKPNQSAIALQQLLGAIDIDALGANGSTSQAEGEIWVQVGLNPKNQ